MNLTALPFVSVIIPVYNDAEQLKTCLGVLKEQTYPEDRYEVIVVDNGSDRSVEEDLRSFDQLQILRETKPGSYAARNKGLSVAKGEVIAFIDSDCIPANNWIEMGVAHLLRVQNCGLIAGQVSLFFKDSDDPTTTELYEQVTAFPIVQYVERFNFGGIGNLFTFGRIFDVVGQFNSDLKSGGDREWGQRVHAHGYRLVYSEETRVFHPARHTFSELSNKARRIVGGEHDLGCSNLATFLRSLVPSLRVLIRIYKDPIVKKHGKRARVMMIAFAVRYLQAWEQLRLVLGGRSRR